MAFLQSTVEDPLPRPYPSRPVSDLVAEQAALVPDRLAVADGAQELTYRQLLERADHLAGRLRALGIGPDVPVGLLLPRSAALVVAALAALRAGGAYLPLDSGAPERRLAYMLSDAEAPVLLTDAGHAPAGRRLAPRTLSLDELGAQQAEVAPTPPAVSDLAYVIYTSGSTGVPKGVMIEHRSLSNLVSWHLAAFEVTWRDRASQLASPAFDAAVWEIWPYLATGASLHVVPEEVRAVAAGLRDWLVERSITIGFLPTPLAEAALGLRWPAATVLRTTWRPIPDIARAVTGLPIDFERGTLLTHHVVETARAPSIRRLVYASGSGVYGDLGEALVHEDFRPLEPISTYGASKLAEEALICSYCHLFGLQACALRFANVVGPRQTHGVGFDFIRKLLADPNSLTILGNGVQLEASVMVGGRWRDVEAGRPAGCATVFVRPGYPERPAVSPDRVVATLDDAVRWILKPSTPLPKEAYVDDALRTPGQDLR